MGEFGDITSARSSRKPDFRHRFPTGLAAVLLVALALVGCTSEQPADIQTAAAPTTTTSATTTPTTSASRSASTTVPSGPGTATVTTETTPTSTQNAATISWRPCEPEVVSKLPDKLAESIDCGALVVPVDYAKPTGPSMTIAMARHRASAPSSERIGSLLLNPGGPGGSGQEFLFAMITESPDALARVIDRFDLIGFDPRGVGGSGQLRCVTDKELDGIYTLDVTPETSDERNAADALDDLFDNGCLAKYGREGLLAISTANTARDMDEIRKSVGDPGLNFLGVSYGTYLGATYASMFPDRVRAMVLDGAFDPTGQDLATQSEISLRGREDAFANWLIWCESSPLCAFGKGDNDGEVYLRWRKLRTAVDETPVKGDNGRATNQGVFMAATGISLYNRDFGWISLGSALKALEDGDGQLMLELADAAYGRNPDGSYDGRVQAGGVITCSSGIAPPPAPDPLDAAKRIRAAGPNFANDVNEKDLTENGCGLLPEGPKAVAFQYDGTGPVLVIGGTNDPATPFEWATKMVAALGNSAQLLTFEGEGHGAVLDSECVATNAASLLIERTAVPSGTVCESASKSQIPTPEWFLDLPAVPGTVEEVDLTDLAPLIGLEPATKPVRVVLSTARSSNGVRILKVLEDAGWSSKDGETLQKKISGTTQRITFGEIDIEQIRDLEPMLAPMANRLLEHGKSIVYITVAPD